MYLIINPKKDRLTPKEGMLHDGGGVFFFQFLINFWLRWVSVAVRGLFFSCGEWGLLFLVVRGLLTAVASLIAEHGL